MSSHPPDHQDTRHPTFKQYVLIAIILFAITLVEFLIIVPQSLRGAAVTLAPLFILSAIKFAIVVMFYMHLKFESRTLTIVFVTGLVLAFLAGGSLLTIFGSLQPTPRDFAAANAVAFIPHEDGEETQKDETAKPEEPGAGAEPANARYHSLVSSRRLQFDQVSGRIIFCLIICFEIIFMTASQ